MGAIVPVTFIISLFNDRVHVFEVHNNGKFYILGFLLGATALWGNKSGGDAASPAPAPAPALARSTHGPEHPPWPMQRASEPVSGLAERLHRQGG